MVTLGHLVNSEGSQVIEQCPGKGVEVCICENLRTKLNSNSNIFEPNRTVREEVRE
jgi:hypothetical protein